MTASLGNAQKAISRRAALSLGVAVVSIVAFVYWDFLSCKTWLLHRDVGEDPICQWWPYWVHLSRYLRVQGFPGWSFGFGLGQSIFPGGLNDPFKCILYLFSGANQLCAVSYVQVLKILLAASLFYVYLREAKISPLSRVVSASLYAFCGQVVLGGCWFTFSTDSLTVALALLSFELYFQKKVWFFLPIAVFFFGVNYVFFFYYHTILLFAYAAIRYLSRRPSVDQAFFRFMLGLCWLYGLGLLLSAVYALPEVFEALQSPRVSGGGSLFGMLMKSGAWRLAEPAVYQTEIFRFFSNDLLGIGNGFTGYDNYFDAPILYGGLLPLLLVPQTLASGDKTRRLLFGGPLLVAILYLIFPYARAAASGFMIDNFCYSAFFIPVTMIVSAAKALDDVEAGRGPNLIALGATLAALLAILTGGYYFLNVMKVGTVRLHVPVLWRCAGFLAAYSALLAATASRRMRSAALALLFGAVCAEAALFSWTTVNARPTLHPADPTGRAWGLVDTKAAVDYLNATDKGFFRIKQDKYTCVSLNDPLLLGFNGTRSYNSFNHHSTLDFIRAMGVPFPHPGVHETCSIQGFGDRYLIDTLVGVKYALVRDVKDAPPGYERLKAFGDIFLFKNDNALPIGFGYTAYLPYEDFMRLPPEKKDAALFKAAVLEPGESPDPSLRKLAVKDIGRLDVAEIAAVRARGVEIEEHDQNRLRGRVHFERPAYLFFSIPYDRGWSLTVDGRPLALRRVDVGFMGAPVSAGPHRVELRYFPPLLALGASLSVGALFVMGVVFFKRGTRLR